jgi:hypothetical protein
VPGSAGLAGALGRVGRRACQRAAVDVSDLAVLGQGLVDSQANLAARPRLARDQAGGDELYATLRPGPSTYFTPAAVSGARRDGSSTPPSAHVYRPASTCWAAW